MRIVLSLMAHKHVKAMNPDKDSKFKLPDTDNDSPEISKSALKRDSDAKQKLGERLALLSDKKLDQLELPTTLRKAVEELKRLIKKGSRAHGGMKRQKQYIGKLMRHVELDPIQMKMQEWDSAKTSEKDFLHEIEKWRDRVITNGDSAIDELYDEFKFIDQIHRQHLRQLQRKANKEKLKNLAPKSARALYKFLRDEVLIDDNSESQSL